MFPDPANVRKVANVRRLADFGTCAVDWPLLDEWDAELARGEVPKGAEAQKGS